MLSSQLERSASYKKGDVWVLDTGSTLLGASGESSQRRPHMAGSETVFLAQAVWHGPSKEGKIEIAPVAGGALPARSRPVVALRCAEGQTELQAHATLAGAMPAQCPIIRCVECAL